MTELSKMSLSLRRRARGVAAGVTALALVGVVGAWYERAPKVEAAAPAAEVNVAPRPGIAADSYADLLSRVAPAVVTIRSEQVVRQTQLPFDDDLLRRFFGDRDVRPRPHRAMGLGSGVVITPDGYVLTNEHVVSGAQKVSVELTDGRSFEAKIVGTDKPTDLAVLKIDASGLPTLPLGNSDSARVGDVVFAVGNPLGIGQSVTMGIVSAKGRASGLGGEEAFEDFIQTDAPINQGNSGGALVNTRGELIGINSQILSPVGYNIGIGFAIPVNMARNVMDQLVKTGTVRRGMLGVTVQTVSPDIARTLGMDKPAGSIVSDVQEDSPAARAGLREGDVILALNGKPVDSSNDLRNHIAPLGPDATVTLTVLRDGRQRDVSVTLAELPTTRDLRAARGSEGPSGGHGLAVQPLTPDEARELGVEGNKGVVVADVDPDGPAAEAGLHRGDVIIQADGKAIGSVEELRSAVADATNEQPSLLLVVRDGRKLFVTLGGARG